MVCNVLVECVVDVMFEWLDVFIEGGKLVVLLDVVVCVVMDG